jgi:hypothetical protein
MMGMLEIDTINFQFLIGGRIKILPCVILGSGPALSDGVYSSQSMHKK